MADLYALTEQDLKTLRDVISLVKGNYYGKGTVSLRPRFVQAPEVYVARTPGGGIAARSGTTPGSATCTFYEMDAGALVSTGLTETVYNLSTSAVAADSYFLVQRDKFNSWFIDQGGGSGGITGIVVKEVDGTPTYTDITTIQVEPGDGYLLSNPLANTVRLELLDATTSQTGVVSTGAQSFGGSKTFVSILHVTDSTKPKLHLEGISSKTNASLYVVDPPANTYYTTTLQTWRKSSNTETGPALELSDKGVKLIGGTVGYCIDSFDGESGTFQYLDPDGVTVKFFQFSGGILVDSGTV